MKYEHSVRPHQSSPMHKKYTLRPIITTILVILLVSVSMPERSFGANKALPSAQRLEEADRLRDNSEHRKAFDIYKDIAATYRADMSKDEKMICLEAIYGCIDDAMALTSFSDVARYMVLAEEIRDSENITDGRLDIYYSCMYMVMGGESGNGNMLAKGYPHALRAFDYYVEKGDRKKMELSFYHLIEYFKSLHDKELLPEIEKASLRFRENITDSRSGEIFMRYYKAVIDEYVNEDYRSAALQYDTIISLLPDDARHARKRATFYVSATTPLIKTGDIAKATEGLNKSLVLADSTKQTEIKLAAFNGLKDLYTSIGDSANAQLYKRKAEALQDSISSFAIADDIYVLDRIKEEKELHHQVALARYRNNILQWTIIFAAVILVTVIVFMLILRCKNAGLTERARILKQLLQEHTAAKSSTAVSPSKAKYVGSNLLEEEKNNIAADIRAVLDSEAVFSPDFSLGTLSEKIGKSPKAVSQVINEIFNTNFSTVVNRIRIYEACRRMDSAEYKTWSVEGIAESVGYSQRNTFSTNFKKFTGMGIREYKKLSEERENSYHSESDD